MGNSIATYKKTNESYALEQGLANIFCPLLPLFNSSTLTQKELQSVHYVTKGHHVLPYNLKKKKNKKLVFDPWAAVWLPLCLTLCKVPARMKLKWKLSATEIMSSSLTLETDSLHSTHFLGSPAQTHCYWALPRVSINDPPFGLCWCLTHTPLSVHPGCTWGTGVRLSEKVLGTSW